MKSGSSINMTQFSGIKVCYHIIRSRNNIVHYLNRGAYTLIPYEKEKAEVRLVQTVNRFKGYDQMKKKRLLHFYKWQRHGNNRSLFSGLNSSDAAGRFYIYAVHLERQTVVHL